MEIKIKCYKDNSRKNQIHKAISLLNGIQNYFFYIPELTLEHELCEGTLNWGNFCRSNISPDSYEIYITEKSFDDNWFSHEGDKISVISIAGWEDYFAPPSLRSYIIYQIAQSSICFEGEITEKMEMRMIHDISEGCMFDLCVHKNDIKLGMVSGAICPRCKGILSGFGITEKAINATERMLLLVRSEAIGRPVIFNEDKAFVVMRYSNNDENDNAFKYGIKGALDSLKIQCVRADDTVASAPILQKIRSHVETSRFIIVKVDSNNLNVYFELGLAMGYDKDVLLICEESLVLHLPTDIKNWECLTYPKGNYEVLKDRIISYFTSNYHYLI